MVTNERTRRVAQEYTSHASLHKQAKSVGKASLELIKQAYIEWTHDNVATDVKLNEWQTLWLERFGTNVGTRTEPKYVIEEYSFGYICKEMRSLRVAHEGGVPLSDIKRVGDIRKQAERVNGKPEAKKPKSKREAMRSKVKGLSKAELRILIEEAQALLDA